MLTEANLPPHILSGLRAVSDLLKQPLNRSNHSDAHQPFNRPSGLLDQSAAYESFNRPNDSFKQSAAYESFNRSSDSYKQSAAHESYNGSSGSASMPFPSYGSDKVKSLHRKEQHSNLTKPKVKN